MRPYVIHSCASENCCRVSSVGRDDMPRLATAWCWVNFREELDRIAIRVPPVVHTADKSVFISDNPARAIRLWANDRETHTKTLTWRRGVVPSMKSKSICLHIFHSIIRTTRVLRLPPRLLTQIHWTCSKSNLSWYFVNQKQVRSGYGTQTRNITFYISAEHLPSLLYIPSLRWSFLPSQQNKAEQVSALSAGLCERETRTETQK